MDTIGYLGRGILHEEYGMPCQDAADCRSMDNGNRVWALSDGAGSAEFAQEAAWGNIEGLMGLFEAHPLEQILAWPEGQLREEIISSCVCALARNPEIFADRPWHFSATLLFFAWDGCRWAAGHLGDGFMMILDRKQEVLVCSEPENRGADNQTYFTVSEDAPEHLRIYTGEEQLPAQLLMVSDGPCAMFRTRHGSLPSAAEELLGYARGEEITSDDTLSEVLDQMNYYAYDRRDDWSVLIWRDGAGYAAAMPWPVRSMLEQERKKQNEIFGREHHGSERAHEGAGAELPE